MVDRAVQRAKTSHQVGFLLRVVVAAILVAACGSNTSAIQPDLSDIPALPEAFQVVYRVLTSNGTTAASHWEVFSQSSPFDVSDLTYLSDPRAGAPPVTGAVSSFDHLYDLNAGNLTLVSDRQPGPGSGADAVGVELQELRRRGLAQSHGRSTLAGRPCSITRFGEPPVGPISPPNGTGYDDLCIDRSGIVLRESWTYHGTAALQRTAVEVHIGVVDPVIQGAPPLSAARRSAAPAVLTVTPLSSPQPLPPSFLATPGPPPGFNPQPAVSTVAYDPTDPTRATDTSTIWAFSAGGSVVTVEAGQGRLPWGSNGTPTVPVLLRGLGTGASALRSDGPEVRFTLDGDRWIRVRGTIPPDRLALYASALMLAGR